MTGCDCGGNAHNEEHADDCAGWRLEVERLREALRDVAERQREACRLRLRAKANDIMDDGGDRKVAMALCLAADRVAATPLVTED